MNNITFLKNSKNLLKAALFYSILMTPRRTLHLPKNIWPIEKTTFSIKAGNRILEPDLYTPRNSKKLPAVVIYCPLALEGKNDKGIVNFLRGVSRMGYATIVPAWLEREPGQIEHDDDVELKATFDYLLNHPQIDPKRISIVGISYGGGISMKFASDPIFAQHVKSLTLIGSYVDLKSIFDFALTKKVKDAHRRPGDYLMYMIIKTVCRHLKEPDRTVCLNFLTSTKPAQSFGIEYLRGKISSDSFALLNELASENPDRQKIENLIPESLWQFVEKFDVRENATRVKQKMLLFHSTEDRMVPVTESEKIHKLASNSQLYLANSFEHTVPKQATIKNIATTYLPSFWNVAKFTRDIFNHTS